MPYNDIPTDGEVAFWIIALLIGLGVLAAIWIAHKLWD